MEYRGQGTPVSQGYWERRHGMQDEELRQDLSPRLNLTYESGHLLRYSLYYANVRDL